MLSTLPTLLTTTLLSLTLLTPTAAHPHPHPRPHAPAWTPGYSLGPAFAPPHGIDAGNSICLGPCVKEVPEGGEGLGCPREFKEEFVHEKQCHMCCITQN